MDIAIFPSPFQNLSHLHQSLFAGEAVYVAICQAHPANQGLGQTWAPWPHSFGYLHELF